MDCKKISFLLVDFYEDVLDTKEKKLVEEHLESCFKCRLKLGEIQKTFEILEKEKTEKPPEIFWTNFLPEVRKRIEDKRATKKAFVFKPELIPFFSAILAILFLGVFLFTKDYKGKIKSFYAERMHTHLEEDFYSFYSYKSSTEKLSELLSSEKDLDWTFILSEEDEIEDSDLLEKVLDERYWEESEINTIIENLSPDELLILEKKLEQLKI